MRSTNKTQQSDPNALDCITRIEVDQDNLTVVSVSHPRCSSVVAEYCYPASEFDPYRDEHGDITPAGFALISTLVADRFILEHAEILSLPTSTNS